MPGANMRVMKPNSAKQLVADFLTKALFRRSAYDTGATAATALAGGRGVLFKAGAPVNNTAADDPDVVGRFIVDSTNKDVYVCTAYTNSSNFTVFKLTR